MLKQILASLDAGSLDMITPENSIMISDMTVKYLSIPDGEIQAVDLENMLDILKISNILYNNTSRNLLPLEDGVYDLLVVKYDNITGNKAPVGAKPIYFNENTQDSLEKSENLTEIVRRVEKKDEMLFFDSITNNSMPIPQDYIISEDTTLINKRVSNTAHEYPELVGTLEKCKFTLIAEALQMGIDLDKDPVKIFERDFLYKHKMMGIGSDELVLELKYDGISVEAEVDGDTIISARTRGDTQFDEASDLTPLFGGYKFHRATGKVPKGTIFGIKFECIVTYSKLALLYQMYGKSYVNARTAATGLTGGLDSRKYRDFLTLVPLATSGLGIEEREVEIQFLNKYYSSGVDLRYQIVNGDYNTLLYQVHKFVDEAEYMRPFIDFMYDGVVVSYTSPTIKQWLGRQNSINKWSIAIKFNAMKKQTLFKGYKFTVGQDGRITPIGYFAPIEFLGGIHDHATVHSLKRFMSLNLRKNDVIDATFRNDVMVYITKPENSYNAKNSNPVIQFPVVCPSCNGEITVSDSGDSAYCLNPTCPSKVNSRVVNMLQKLNIKDFAEASVKALGIKSFSDLYYLNKERATQILGQVNGLKIMDRVNQLHTMTYPDYRVVGAIGFSSLSAEKWKLILKNIKLESILEKSDYELGASILCIKGLGKEAANTVIAERGMFMDDLLTIISMPNIERSFGDTLVKKQVRFTGCTDKELESVLNDLGFDADRDKSVTKKTDILVVPYLPYSSGKMNKISPQCVVMPLDQAWEWVRKMKV